MRSRSVRLAGVTLTTPLLIPSVSSRGFPFDANGISESNLYLQWAVASLDETLLVSAYDLKHATLDHVAELLAGSATDTAFDAPKLLVVDSGGYETGNAWESGHAERQGRPAQPYNHADYVKVVSQLPLDRPTLLVSYDGPDLARSSYQEQIRTAQSFFAEHPHFSSNFLLKPPQGFISPRELAPVAPDLAAFDVIGFTEKELGDSYLERACTLYGLRKLLDAAGVDAPIHLFGALDPLFTPLYFALGAEIFDGLSWMRYLYLDGLALHPDAGALLRESADDNQRLRDAKRTVTNLGYLREMKRRMERFAASAEQKFETLSHHGDLMSELHATVRARTEAGGNHGR